MKELDYLLKALISENPKYRHHQIPNDLGEKRKLFRILTNIRPPHPVSKITDFQIKKLLKLQYLPS